MSVSFVAGQLPPVFFICLIISFLCLNSFLHLNIKWSTVSSSSSHGHIRLSVSPSLYKYDFMLPCPVSIVHGNIKSYLYRLGLTDNRKTLCCSSSCTSCSSCRPPYTSYVYVSLSISQVQIYFSQNRAL